MNGLSIVESVPRMQRVMREPSHTHACVARPWAIVPFMIAPVLPGETLKNLTLQGRSVSDPLKNKLGGWWQETFYFYVKHRDLDDRDTVVSMHLTNAPLTSMKAAADDGFFYNYKNGVNWLKLAYKRIVEEYFRDEGEAWNVATWDGTANTYALASIDNNRWWDNLIDATTTPATGNELQDESSDNTVLSAYQAQYDRMRQMRATNMTFDDWLKMHGVANASVPIGEDLYKPELLRYERDFTYPTNTVDPITGSPSAAAVWSTTLRADKDRYFKEPGFVIGLTVFRPKIFMKNQKGAAVGALDEARLWLPATLRDEPYTSIKQHASGASPDGPLGATPTNGYWTDYRDLFLKGDQFVNTDSATNPDICSMVALPSASLARRYPALTDLDALFVDSTAGVKCRIRFEGITSLKVLGTAGFDYT